MNKDQLPKNGMLYLEAFPFHQSIIDLCDLEADEREFATMLAKQLVAGKLDLSFQSHSRSEEKLHHLYFESRNQERTGGQRSIAVGFPLFLSREGAKVRLAPLFTWQVSIDPDPHRPNFWTLRSVQGKGPAVNPLLALLLPEGESLPSPGWEDPAIPEGKTIQQYGGKLAEALHTTWQDNWETPFPIPPLEVLGDLAEQSVILPCMVLGAFKPVFLSSGDALGWDPRTEPLPPPGNRQPFERSRFSPLQATAWEVAHQNATTLVEQIDHKDTADWVTELLYNALANGERTLLVSDRISKLSHIQTRLSASGVDWLTFLLKDPSQDAYLLTELLKARLLQEGGAVPFPQDDFKMLLAKGLRHKEKLDKAFQSLRQELLGPYNWTDLVGMYLKSSMIEGKELLSNQLTTQDLLFQIGEYEAFKEVIAKSIPLYNRLNTLKHPLNSLHPAHFLQTEKATALRNIEKLIHTHTGRLEALNHEVLRQTDAYALKLNDHLEQGFLSLYARLHQVQETYTDHANKFGDTFEKGGASSAKLKGLFNSRAKQITQAKEEVTQAYLALARHHQERNFFDHTFLGSSEARSMGRLSDSLRRYGQALNEWRQRIRERVLEELARLNRQTVYPEIGFEETIAQLEERIDNTLADLNQAQIYSEQMEANMLTLPKKQKFLDSILEKLETTGLNLRDFDPFYDWQRHWLQLSDPQQRVMRALIKVKPQNWTSAFESWYLHHCLNRHFSDDLPTDDQALKSYYETWTSLQSYLPPLVENLWLDRQQKAFKSWKRHNKQGFQSWVGKARHSRAPKTWFDGNWGALHNLFPVWLMSDSLAATLYDPENCPELDWVIVWEHQEIEPFLWQALAPRVKRWVVVGDGQGALFRFLKNNGWDPVPLASFPHDAPKNAVASDTREEAPRPGIQQTITVSGLYDFSKHTNEAEAQEVIRVLNDIRPTPARTFPSVAILTLTVEQRDLIARYLLQIKQRNQQGSEKIRSLERNGLAVLHIDEYIGSAFDQVILSTAIGPVDVQGSLPPDVAYFSSSSFERALIALEQSTGQQKYLLHSFSEAHLSAPRMSSFLRLENPQEYFRKKQVEEGLVSGFNREIQALLQSYFDDWRFLLPASRSGLRMPLLLKSEREALYEAALLPDQFLANTRHTSYSWEWKAREAIQEGGYHLHPVWSVAFWRNPRQEARKLASRVLSVYNRLVKDEARKEPIAEEPEDDQLQPE